MVGVLLLIVSVSFSGLPVYTAFRNDLLKKGPRHKGWQQKYVPNAGTYFCHNIYIKGAGIFRKRGSSLAG
jgi:hypothetical protein